MNEDAKTLCRRVFISALVAWPIVCLAIAVHFIWDPFRSELGFDLLMVSMAIPALLCGYGFYIGLIYLPQRRYRTSELALGFVLHIVLVMIAMFVLWLES